MDRSKFPQGVEVQQTDLEYTETGKAQQILRRFLDGTQTGVAEGCEVTPSGTPGRVAVAEGRAYALNGEWIPVSATSAVEMADATLSAVNIICAVYAEVDTEPGAHETDGTVKYRRAVASGSVVAYTQSQYDALSTEAKNNTCILAKVTAQGAGVALSTTDIESPITFTRKYVVANAGSNIAGITIVGFSANTQLTTDPGMTQARINLNTIAGAPDVYYEAPADGALGPVTVVTDSREYTVQSSTAAYTCTMLIDPAMVPRDYNSTWVMDITALYEEEVSPLSADDKVHRNLVGGSTVSVGNPHGMRADDLPRWGRITGGLRLGAFGTDEPIQPAEELCPPLVIDQSPTAPYTEIAAFGGPGSTGMQSNTRLYRTAVGLSGGGNAFLLVQNAKFEDATAGDWVKDDGQDPTAVEITESGGINFWRERGGGGPASTFQTTAWELISSFGGAGELSDFPGYLATDTDATIPRIRADMSTAAGSRTLLFQSGRTGDIDGQMRIYRYHDGSVFRTEMTYNAVWNPAAGGSWSSDSAGRPSARYINSRFGESMEYQPAGAVPWSDAAWTYTPLSTVVDGVGIPTVTIGDPAPGGSSGTVLSKTNAAAWGTVSVAVGPVFSVTGYNVGSVTNHSSGLGGYPPNDLLRVNFASNMANTTYTVIATYNGNSPRSVIARTKAQTHVDFSWIDLLTSPPSALTSIEDFGAGATGSMCFTVFQEF